MQLEYQIFLCKSLLNSDLSMSIQYCFHGYFPTLFLTAVQMFGYDRDIMVFCSK